MNTVEISQRLKASTFALEAYEGDQIYSTGTGFGINENGLLVTAAHVVTGRLPIQRKDWMNPKPKVIAYRSGTPEIEYRPLLCGLKVHMAAFTKPLTLDVAVLTPTRKIDNFPFLNISSKPAPLGAPVMMAGYPDELEPPLLFIRALDKNSDVYQNSDENIDRELEKSKQLLMIKSGMVGHTNNANFTPDDDTSWELRIKTYYLDNGMHRGASGGPVVNDLGEVIGVITKRAVTTVSYPDLEHPNKDVPSGSTLAISPQSVLSYIRREFQRGNVIRTS